MVRTSASLDKSAWQINDFCPVFSTAAADCNTLSRDVRYVKATCEPACASAVEIACPMRAPPVMRVTVSCNFMQIISYHRRFPEYVVVSVI